MIICLYNNLKILAKDIQFCSSVKFLNNPKSFLCFLFTFLKKCCIINLSEKYACHIFVWSSWKKHTYIMLPMNIFIDALYWVLPVLFLFSEPTRFLNNVIDNFCISVKNFVFSEHHSCAKGCRHFHSYIEWLVEKMIMLFCTNCLAN